MTHTATSPDLPSLPCDPDVIPQLRLGRRVPQHVYLRRRSGADEPLCTLPDHLARFMVDGFEALRWLNVHPPNDAATLWASEVNGVVTSALNALHETLVDQGDHAGVWEDACEALTREILATVPPPEPVPAPVVAAAEALIGQADGKPAARALRAALDAADRTRTRVGYVVLSDHIDRRTGRPGIDVNWDGELHPTREAADLSAAEANDDALEDESVSWAQVGTVTIPTADLPPWWGADAPTPTPPEDR